LETNPRGKTETQMELICALDRILESKRHGRNVPQSEGKHEILIQQRDQKRGHSEAHSLFHSYENEGNDRRGRTRRENTRIVKLWA